MKHATNTLHALLPSLLRPVARFALRHTFKIQELTEALKKALVDAAREEIERSGSEISVSKLSVMSGMQRRDVQRLLEGPKSSTQKTNVFIKIIGQWQSDKRFKKAGKPRPLSCEGKKSEFVSLVRTVSKDLNAYAVLFELERAQMVRREGDLVILQTLAYMPRDESLQGLSMAATDMTELLSAVNENVFDREEVPNLHARTNYDNICIRFLPEIRAWFIEKGAALHAECRRYLAQFDKDLNPKLYKEQGGGRVTIGTFSLTEAPQVDIQKENSPTESGESENETC